MAKKRAVAIMLAFMGGIFGMHKFYLRDTGQGVFFIALLFMSLSIFGMPITFFLGLFDAIKLINMSDERFDQKYNKNTPYNNGRRRRRSTKYQNEEPRRRTTKRRTSQPSATRRPARSTRRRSNPFKTSAYKKYKDFDLEDALVDYKQALEISPDDKEIHFYMASVYSLSENKEKSYFHLDQAVQLGLKQTEKIMTSDDFAFLRIQAEFEAFKNNGFRVQQKSDAQKPNENLVMDDLLLSQLNKLKEMRDRGLLSEKEFITEKEKIIRR